MTVVVTPKMIHCRSLQCVAVRTNLHIGTGMALCIKTYQNYAKSPLEMRRHLKKMVSKCFVVSMQELRHLQDGSDNNANKDTSATESDHEWNPEWERGKTLTDLLEI